MLVHPTHQDQQSRVPALQHKARTVSSPCAKMAIVVLLATKHVDDVLVAGSPRENAKLRQSFQ
eukprot:4889196-Pyramimonas_sp.AAC.1